MKNQKTIVVIITVAAVLFLGLAIFGIEMFRSHKKGGDETEFQKDSIIMEQTKEPQFDIVTTMGTIRVKLYDKTPKHKENFCKLVAEHYYDSLLFHRVINGFMIQTGDPYTKDSSKVEMYGQGGPGYTVPAEFVPEYWHKKGALAAARRGDYANPKKSSSGSQFYIVQDENNCLHLDGEYTVFGETVEGLDIIDKIASAPVDRYDRPLEDIRVITIKPVVEEKENGGDAADSLNVNADSSAVENADSTAAGNDGSVVTDGNKADGRTLSAAENSGNEAKFVKSGEEKFVKSDVKSLESEAAE